MSAQAAVSRSFVFSTYGGLVLRLIRPEDLRRDRAGYAEAPSVEIEVGDGTKRILRTGDVLLAEDTTGQGHISRAVNGKPRRSLFITLED